MRLIECGDQPFIKNALPDQTQFFQINFRDVPSPSVRHLLAAFSDPETSIVICHAVPFPVWHWQWLSRYIFSRRIKSRGLPILSSLAVQALRFLRSRPLAVLDFSDSSLIEPSNLFLLDRCTLYFKRELPIDSWKVFQKTAHYNLPTPRFRKSDRQLRRIDKLRPLPLGLPMSTAHLLPIATQQKKHDVFFSGQVTGSSAVRQRGMAELLALQSAGFSIDIADKRMSPLEFYRRCSEAWLVWSPEGLGWDCFRHYEALASGSVPIISQPTVQRYMPLVEGQHALFYEPYDGELTRVITAALLDKQRLMKISEAGRSYVMQHHTPGAIARYVIDATNNALHH